MDRQQTYGQSEMISDLQKECEKKKDIIHKAITKPLFTYIIYVHIYIFFVA